MRVNRLVIVLLAAVAAVTIAPTPAHATPSGEGWSGSWAYTGGTSIDIAVEVPGAKVVANGWDALGVRAFVVTLSGRCWGCAQLLIGGSDPAEISDALIPPGAA